MARHLRHLPRPTRRRHTRRRRRGRTRRSGRRQLAPAPFYRPRSARILARCDAKRLTFTCVLYGAADERARLVREMLGDETFWAAVRDYVARYAGKVVEEGPAEDIFDRPRTEYTKALMAAAFDLAALSSDAVAT